MEHRNGGAVDTYRAVLSPDGRTVRTYMPEWGTWQGEHRPSVIRTFRPVDFDTAEALGYDGTGRGLYGPAEV